MPLCHALAIDAPRRIHYNALHAIAPATAARCPCADRAALPALGGVRRARARPDRDAIAYIYALANRDARPDLDSAAHARALAHRNARACRCP